MPDIFLGIKFQACVFFWVCNRKLRQICPASCPVIRIFLLEQKQTWRATGLLVSIRVRTHETTLLSDWTQKNKGFVAPIRSQNDSDRLELVR